MPTVWDMDDGTKDFWSAAKVAHEFGVDIRTVHRMVSDGRLTPEGKMPGKRGAYLFRPAAVRAVADGAPLKVKLPRATRVPARAKRPRSTKPAPARAPSSKSDAA